MSLWFRRSYERVLQRDTNVGTGTLVALLLGVAVVPRQHLVLDQQEQAIEDVAQRRRCQHARAHLADLEAPLRAQDEVAYAAISSESLQLFGIRLWQRSPWSPGSA